MEPKDYKGRTVTHLPTDYTFKVIGGRVKQGHIFLKDSRGKFYSIYECKLHELNRLKFDVRKLKQVKTLKELVDFFDSRGWDRFQEAWAELEKDPVEAAAVAILYCHNWEGFCLIADEYGVSKKRSSELNARFCERLSAKGLSKIEWGSQKLVHGDQV